MEPFVIRVTRTEVVGTRAIPKSMEENLSKLLVSLNKFRAIYGFPMTVTSGYRSLEEHIEIYRKKAEKAGVPLDASKIPMGSSHLSCQACDFADPDGALDKFCQDNISVLEQLGLWVEHPDSTPGWCHLDIKPRSTRFFRP